MVTALLWVLAALGLLLVAALVLPVRIRLTAGTEPHRRAQIWISALGGVIPPLPAWDSDKRKQEAKPQQKAKARPAGHRDAARNRRLFMAGVRLIPDLLREIRLRKLEVDGVLGLDDPADTGAVFGALSPLLYALPSALPAETAITLRPEFGGRHLEGRLEAEIGLVPARFALPVLRFAWAGYGAGTGR